MRREILLITLMKFSFQPLTAETGFDPGAVHVMFVVVTKLGQDFFRVFQFSLYISFNKYFILISMKLLPE